MLHILVANRFESLQNALHENLAHAPASPFAAQQIIIPSAAIKRALTLGVSRHLGICANVQFSFLAQWLWRQIAQVLPQVAAESPFAAPVLAWRVFALLQDTAFVAAHPRLARYLQQASPVMTYDLAVRIALQFEQYLTYRPDWLAAWSSGRMTKVSAATPHADEAWQAALWQRIAKDLGAEREHPAAGFLRIMATLGPDAQRRTGLPETADIFCLPTIPPLYIDLLRQLGRWIDLRLYLLNPCQEYWFEIVDRRRLSYLAARGDVDYHEVGNRLLANWGKQTQALMDLVLADALVDGVDGVDGAGGVVADAVFQENDASTLLGRLQNAILALEELPAHGADGAMADRSIEVHVCHSLTRELEVLHDQLLALFAGQNPPQPAEILVVTPDIEAAAPLIDAVFGNVPQARAIPFAITGRARSRLNAPAQALCALLDLLASRFAASAVFELLQQPIMARRLGFGVSELERVRDWIDAAGIRWGLDGAHRASHDLPAFEQYSIDDGLQRLFLGYALPDHVAAPWQGRLPAGHAEGGEAVLLGVFAEVLGRLAALQREFAAPKSAAGWREALLRVMDVFFAPDEDELDDVRELREILGELHDNMVRGGVTEASAVLPLDVVRVALDALLDDPARGGVPTGAVTFSSMSSLRAIPYRIICVIGLDDGAFPSRVAPSEFDLMLLQPRRGDRQRRIDERNLFLDLLLAARERFYLSYSGRSIRDNAVLPPSILISELLDVLALPNSAARKRLVIEHPLQPFSPDCFDVDADLSMRSFHHEYCEALQRGRARGAAFFVGALTAPEPAWRDVSLDSLIQFFRQPSRFLLRDRLGIALRRAEEDLNDEEPFLPDFGGRQALAERLLPLLTNGSDCSAEALRAQALAGVEYPPGALGRLSLESELATLMQFAAEVARHGASPLLPAWHGAVEFELGEPGECWRLSGAFSDLRAEGLVRHRYDDTRAVDYLSGWIAHLFLCATGSVGSSFQTRWLSRNGSYLLHPCPAARETLQALLVLYRRGLREPLHFFPKSAWKYIASKENLSQARSTWHSTRERPWGECEDAYYKLALRGKFDLADPADPIDATFTDCARTVFGTMMLCIEDARL